MRNVVRIPAPALRVLAAMLLTAAALVALWLAWADYLFQTGRPENVRWAARLVPFHALYQARAGNLTRAVELDPNFSSAWMELAEQADKEDRVAEAERHFRKAAEVDQQFAPRWALANFYFRQERWAEFDEWIRLAAERSYGDRGAMFRLAHQGQGARPVVRLWPDNREVLGDYMRFLAGRREWREAAAAGRRFLAVSRTEDRDAVLDLCSEMLRAGEVGAAREVWNAAVAKLLPGYAPVSADTPLSNGDFDKQPLGKGFDWHRLWQQGLVGTWREGRLRMELDGRQFDRTELLEQRVAVGAGTYRLSWRVDTEGIRAGIRFRVYDLKGAELPVGEHDLARQGELREVAFRVPGRVEGARLVLTYERRPGTTRQEGAVIVDRIGLARALE